MEIYLLSMVLLVSSGRDNVETLSLRKGKKRRKEDGNVKS